MEPIWEYTIKLIRFVLNGDVPELPENIDFEKLFAFGKSHGVENMLYVGLRDLHIDVPEETMQKFKTAYEMQIMVEAIQALELEAISEAFEEAGIDHVPLKGSVIKYLYPMPDYRKSGDIDILIRPEDEAKAEAVMIVLGYSPEDKEDDSEIHRAYHKFPNVLVEMHYKLAYTRSRSYNFCNTIWENVIKKEDKYLCSMPSEFMYVYLLAHICRHLYKGGAGIKMITDLWVIEKNTSLNKELLERYLAYAKIESLFNVINEIIEKWYGSRENLSQNANILMGIIFRSGLFGTVEIASMITNNDSTENRVSLLWKRIFPSKKVMLKQYKDVRDKDWSWLRIWIYRVADIALYKRKNVKKLINSTILANEQDTDIKEIVDMVKDE